MARTARKPRLDAIRKVLKELLRPSRGPGKQVLALGFIMKQELAGQAFPPDDYEVVFPEELDKDGKKPSN